LKPFKPESNVALSKRPVCVMLPVEIDTAVRALSNSSEWLRRVIVEAAEQELMERNDGAKQ
jgi:hypothetical protein